MKKATLQIALTDSVYAYQLHGIIYVIDELYTSYRWLDLANVHRGELPYGDSEFDVDDFLIIKRLEIGTPNIIELYGLIQPLQEAILYLGGISGVVSLLKDGTEAYKNWQEAREKKEQSTVLSDLKIAQEKEKLIRAKIENELLLRRLRERDLSNEPFLSPMQIAQELHWRGRVSSIATEYKTFSDLQIQDRLQKGVFETAVVHMNLIPD